MLSARIGYWTLADRVPIAPEGVSTALEQLMTLTAESATWRRSHVCFERPFYLEQGEQTSPADPQTPLSCLSEHVRTAPRRRRRVAAEIEADDDR